MLLLSLLNTGTHLCQLYLPQHLLLDLLLSLLLFSQLLFLLLLPLPLLLEHSLDESRMAVTIKFFHDLLLFEAFFFVRL